MIASAVANVAIATDCRRASAASFTTAQVVGNAALVSRPRSRPMSALERMRAQQEAPRSALSPLETSTIAARASYMPALAAMTSVSAPPAPIAVDTQLAPAAFGITCATRFDAARPGSNVVLGGKKRDFLESRILPVSTTAFDADWRRVSQGRAGAGFVRKAVLSAEASDGSLEDRIAKVNRWVNRRVAYTADAKLYGKADYWATPAETLKRGKGDCEDYAIAKMALLAAMGVAREDMYLTIARDLVRRDDHAVLIVKLDGRSIMLDNASDELLDGDRANDYRPILSFSADKRFLHGY